MSLYSVSPLNATAGVTDVRALGSRVVAVPVSALVWPVREDSGAEGRSGLVVAPAVPIRSGDLVVWCTIVAVTRAKVSRDGRVQAVGRPGELARIGALEDQLDAVAGPGTIDRVAAEVTVAGKIKGVRRRELDVGFVMRAVLLMTLMPDADYRQVMTVLLGDLMLLPWERARVVPSPTVLSRWRAAIGAQPLQRLLHLVLDATAVELRSGATGIDVGGGLRVGSIDGSVTRMPDTPANRDTFGTSTSAGSGFPQIRHLLITDAFTRAALAVVTGPAGGDKGEAEQQLLDRALTECPQVFTPDRLWLMDRNFPGVPRINAVLAAGSHILIRVKSDIRLPPIGDPHPDGSYLARLSGGGQTLSVRVIEYHVTLAGTTTPELFCLITDLLDPTLHPAHLLAAAYRWRWDGSETTLRETKSTLHGAGPGTGVMLRSHTPTLIEQEHAAWIAATALVHALTRTAAATSRPHTKGPRTGQPVQARDLSFTTARRTAIASITAALPSALRTQAHATAVTAIAANPITTDRNRHRDRKIKSSQPFPHATPGMSTIVIPALIHVCGASTPASATVTDLRTAVSAGPPAEKITEYAA